MTGAEPVEHRRMGLAAARCTMHLAAGTMASSSRAVSRVSLLSRLHSGLVAVFLVTIVAHGPSELSRFLFVWTAFLGMAAVIQARRTPANVTVLTDRNTR